MNSVTTYPDFYEAFCCKADKCQHACCAGWEIDIDVATAAKYRQLGGALGESIRHSIVEIDGVWQFRLGPGSRCPFLCENGLCEIIRRADESPCDICANHPNILRKAMEQNSSPLAVFLQATNIFGVLHFFTADIGGHLKVKMNPLENLDAETSEWG